MMNKLQSIWLQNWVNELRFICLKSFIVKNWWFKAKQKSPFAFIFDKLRLCKCHKRWIRFHTTLYQFWFIYDSGVEEIAKMLMEHGADVNATDNFGNIAIHLAARQGTCLKFDLNWIYFSKSHHLYRFSSSRLFNSNKLLMTIGINFRSWKYR